MLNADIHCGAGDFTEASPFWCLVAFRAGRTEILFQILFFQIPLPPEPQVSEVVLTYSLYRGVENLLAVFLSKLELFHLLGGAIRSCVSEAVLQKQFSAGILERLIIDDFLARENEFFQ
jgi:hypothetical protein